MMHKKFELVQRVDFMKGICKGKKVLHLGCTNYPYTRESLENNMLVHFELQKAAKELYGFDFDLEGIKIMTELGVENIIWADLEKLDEISFDEKFDVIIAGEIIEHLSNPGLFLKGIQRFMNADTKLVITTINAYGGLRNILYGLKGEGGANEPVHPDHVAYYSYKTLNMILKRENLVVSEFLFYDIGAEHRIFNRWFYNLTNDLCVKFTPQFSDGVIAVCTLPTK